MSKNQNGGRSTSKKSKKEPQYSDSELIIGLVGAIGTPLDLVCDLIKGFLKVFQYQVETIKVSNQIIETLTDAKIPDGAFERANALMNEGNKLREKSGDNSILALAAAARIYDTRESSEDDNGVTPKKRTATIINSLKHHYEIERLRNIYHPGVFIFGVYSCETDRIQRLIRKGMHEDQAEKLIRRDEAESKKHGQQVRAAFHLSDFFISFNSNLNYLEAQISRILDLIFGNPFVTPTFDEYSMFLAFSSALRSADLSRQVGAVLTKGTNIIATGANDVPKADGGLYWPSYNEQERIFCDSEGGRDYRLGYDTNTTEKRKIIDKIVNDAPKKSRKKIKKALKQSSVMDITEYGRVVHAEMEALLTCSRMGISTQDAEIFCTTFPCHNCAKHIISSGVRRVVFIEPYPKSKALDFHKDSISVENTLNKVLFEPFIGVGPRSYFNLFSLNLGIGYELKRKNSKNGLAVNWKRPGAKLRLQLLPISYLDREGVALNRLEKLLKK
ncbi:CMP/dCMP-type deaminase domain-containing protein [Sulfidibacter corallicola]|uniref:CMP/dCMP-type deaminase domain-containing protein n=1 Tax=Sulfidibacter corallicola TaxID=2818388 RepID=A0A8A4TY78_SULCO|nr:anti-phage dCTP deaminase [Sulfidibacter corallicola]QTD54201.1 hypothetical protein J3U87_17280 [Sulfidibacter corallicola]